MEITFLESRPIDPTIKECKGLYWRGSVNIFTDDSGRVSQRKEVRLLKRKSCPGCETCGWVIDFLREFISDDPFMEILSEIKHGKLYSYAVDHGRDWETGIDELEGIYFVEVAE